MNEQTARRLARSLWTLAVLIDVVTLAFQFANDRSTFVDGVFGLLVNLAFVTVGALIVSRRHENFIGWIFLVGVLIQASGEMALEYAIYGLVTVPGSLTSSAWAAFYGDWARGFGFFLVVTYLFLLFPDGQVPSARWRVAAWLPIIGLILLTVGEAFTPTPNDFRLQSVTNPLGFRISQDLGDLLSSLAFLVPLANVLVGAAAVIFRFRRASGDEREQLKWFAYAAAMGTCLFVGLWANAIMEWNTSYAVGAFFFTLAIAGIPVATGIAILKYRLYDIDLLIRRTLIYAVLTALLALVYLGSVVVLQQLLAALTGEQRNEIVTVLSTLAIAALFVPLRRHVQDSIDHRFYRRKYDAQQVLARFGATARDEVELEKLTGELLDVVQETMQPAGVSLWLRAPEGKKQ